MSQSAIGKAALILSANGAGLRTDLQREGKNAEGWAERTAKAIGGHFRGIGASIGIGGGLRLNAEGFGTALGAAGIAGVTKVQDTLAEMARGGAAAKAFGLSAEQFTGIAGVARSVGEEQREFIESLVTLGKVASEGAAGKGEVATAWFKSLNLDAQQFKALRLDQQFLTVFDAIRKVEDPAERVRALMVAFGEDGGKYLLPLLSKSGEELRAMAAGFAVSTEQVEKATKANQAWQAATAQMDKAWREFAVSAAPLLETLADRAGRLAAGFTAAAQAADRAAASGGGGGERPWYAEPEWFQYVDPTQVRAENWGPGFSLAWRHVADFFTGGDRAFAYERALLNPPPATPPPGPGPQPGVLSRWAADVRAMAARQAAGARDATDILGLFGLQPATGQDRLAGLAGAWVGAGRDVAGMFGAMAAAPAAEAALKRLDNPALLKGSSAEVSARLRNDLAGSTAAEKTLAEQRKHTALLGEIKAGIEALGGAGLNPW